MIISATKKSPIARRTLGAQDSASFTGGSYHHPITRGAINDQSTMPITAPTNIGTPKRRNALDFGVTGAGVVSVGAIGTFGSWAGAAGGKSSLGMRGIYTATRLR